MDSLDMKKTNWILRNLYYFFVLILYATTINQSWIYYGRWIGASVKELILSWKARICNLCFLLDPELLLEYQRATMPSGNLGRFANFVNFSRFTNWHICWSKATWPQLAILRPPPDLTTKMSCALSVVAFENILETSAKLAARLPSRVGHGEHILPV